MIVLGIETSCDDTSIALIEEKNQVVTVLSHLSFSQDEILRMWGGVVPEIAARNHLDKLTPLLNEAFNKAKLKIQDVDLIGVTTFPGLLGPLLTGINAAKTISLLIQKPIVAVNHLFAHLEAIHLQQAQTYPYLGLLVSGGHSAFFYVEAANKFKLIGTTLDDAAGEAFDKGGKLLGLGYPAGRIIDQMAKFGDPKKVPFSLPMKNLSSADLSFSGIKTALRVYLDKNPKILELKPTQYQTKENASQDFYDLCASYQEIIIENISQKLTQALKTVPKKTPIVVGGGVACNSALRTKLSAQYKQVSFVKPEYCTDNGAMIANYALRTKHEALTFPECLKLDAKSRFIEKVAHE
ncbi:MAG: tRNA (adenosine(37)-N6)-threonylcarbamoyltransferase complex transferase subunit TsaD [Bacteriovoracaceae bacterium]|nr:tRNA (adenosine(37)-N6)-threonylcarbamoyltransferase complex transferase subunit TsaD [Bacteriovoracaceae bacterium]